MNPSPLLPESTAEPECGPLIARARLWLSGYEARHQKARIALGISDATALQYRRIHASIEASCVTSNETPGAYASRLTSPRSFIHYRSSYYWVAWQRIPELIARLTARGRPNQLPVRASPSDPDDLIDAKAALAKLLANLASFEGRRGTPRLAPPRRTRIVGLPTDWREILLDALPESHRFAFLACALSGCRPKELAKGIRILRKIRTDLTLVHRFEICGAKLTATAGQPLRRLERPADGSNLSGRFDLLLLKRLESGSEGGICLRHSPGPLNGAIARAAARLWPTHARLSLYALRYQFADELRAQGADLPTLARALGHTSERSHIAYTRRRPRSGRVPERHDKIIASATRPVRGYELELRDLARMQRERTAGRSRCDH